MLLVCARLGSFSKELFKCVQPLELCIARDDSQDPQEPQQWSVECLAESAELIVTPVLSSQDV